MSLPPLTLAGDHCTVHGYHWPPINRTVKHHIKPIEYGGQTVPENLVLVCDNGHYSIHACIEASLDGLPLPKVTRAERALALQGLAAIRA